MNDPSPRSTSSMLEVAHTGVGGVVARWGLPPDAVDDLLPPTAPDEEQLLRASLILGIYRGIEQLFRRAPAEADAWPTRSNSDVPFDGDSPVAFMRNGGLPALAATRAYVETWIAGGP